MDTVERTFAPALCLIYEQPDSLVVNYCKNLPDKGKSRLAIQGIAVE